MPSSNSNSNSISILNSSVTQACPRLNKKEKKQMEQMIKVLNSNTHHGGGDNEKTKTAMLMELLINLFFGNFFDKF